MNDVKAGVQQPEEARPDDPRERQVRAMADLLLLQKQAREAGSVEELGHLLVNDTAAMIDYRSAVLWLRTGPSGSRIAAISGLPEPNAEAPFSRWADNVLRELALDTTRIAPGTVTAADIDGPLAAEWPSYLPANGLWAPLRFNDTHFGGLLLARDRSFGDAEARLIGQWSDAAAHALDALQRRRRKRIGGLLNSGRRKIAAAVIAIALIAAMALPVRLSVLAPAEVVGNQAAVVRAPLNGVIDRVLVTGNQAVEQGQPLITLDPTEIETRLQVARQSLEIAEAEHRQATQAAFADPSARALVGVLARRIDQSRAELAYVESLRDRLTVTAPRDGIAVLPDARALIGSPVDLGARILEIADPDDPSLEIWLPAGDGLVLSTGAPIDFFLNTAPEAPIPATLTRTAFRASPSPTGTLAFRLEGGFTETADKPRIGLRGVAKLYGEPVALGYLLLRRPLAAIRQWLGV